MIEITKRLFFDYTTQGEIDRFIVEVPLFNKNFEDLIHIEPQGELKEDKFGNIFVEYNHDFPDPMTIAYKCKEKEDKQLLIELFRDAREIIDVYQAPDYNNVESITKSFLKNGGGLTNLKNFLRDNYSFPKCEDASKVAALVGSKAGYKVAAVCGFVNIESPYTRKITIKSKFGGKKADTRLKDSNETFNDEIGHRWTLITDSRKYDVCDPAIIPNGEKRFVEQVNKNNSVSTNLYVTGIKEFNPVCELNTSIYTEVGW